MKEASTAASIASIDNPMHLLLPRNEEGEGLHSNISIILLRR